MHFYLQGRHIYGLGRWRKRFSKTLSCCLWWSW